MSFNISALLSMLHNFISRLSSLKFKYRWGFNYGLQPAVAELVFATTGNKPNMDMLIFNVDPNVDEAGTSMSTKVASCTNTYELVRARASHHDTLTGYSVRGTSLHAQWL